MSCNFILSPTDSLPSSYALQEVKVPVIGNKQCTCNYANVENATITDKMICAGQENKGACQVKIITQIIKGNEIHSLISHH